MDSESSGSMKVSGKRKNSSNQKRHTWSEEQVINLLQTAIKIPHTNPKDRDAFYKSVKACNDIMSDLTNQQIRKKLSSLKRTYAAKLQKNKNFTVSANEHEKLVFSLSKMLWGSYSYEEEEEEDASRQVCSTGVRICINCREEIEEIEDRLNIDLTRVSDSIFKQIKDIKIDELKSLLDRCLITKHLTQTMINSYPKDV